MATRDDIKRTILKLRYLPNSPMTADNIAELTGIYFDILSDLTPETLEAAARQYLSTDTFFPTPGKLRETALDLQLLALGIPTPAEAWGMVIGAKLIQEAVFCEDGARLREAATGTGREYFIGLAEYGRHMDTCPICNAGGSAVKYAHPAVTETVKLLGGRDILLTDNPAADRKQFIDAYREIVGRERAKVGMLPEVRNYVASLEVGERRAALDTGERDEVRAQIKRLARSTQ